MRFEHAQDLEKPAVGVLPAGTYNVDLAGQKRTLQIPSATAPACN